MALNVAGSGELQVTGATVVMPGTVAGISLARITGGSATFDVTAPAKIGQLILQGGALGGTGTVNVTNQFTWNGGALMGTDSNALQTARFLGLGWPEPEPQRVGVRRRPGSCPAFFISLPPRLAPASTSWRLQLVAARRQCGSAP